MSEATLDELFPFEDGFKPLPWVTIAGGLKRWDFRVFYFRRDRDFVQLEAHMTVPSSIVYDRSEAPVRLLLQRLVYLGHGRVEMVRREVVDFIHSAALHEVDESIIVDGRLWRDPHPEQQR